MDFQKFHSKSIWTATPAKVQAARKILSFKTDNFLDSRKNSRNTELLPKNSELLNRQVCYCTIFFFFLFHMKDKLNTAARKRIPQTQEEIASFD